MKIAPGKSVGNYEVISSLGVGGMGEVYLAKDTRLGREVALKVLPDALAHDLERRSRFEREARVLASLNHPNIATLHGFHEFGGHAVLEMELVPGDTLAERVQRKPLSVDEALPIFKQIALALESAHDRGIIHRDLKPSNVKVMPDGRVKVLDFGLAKALDRPASADPADVQPHDVTSASHSRTGMILGTVRYMSPEQARGLTLDRRTDIWSFGCVLYEALTGRPPFAADSTSDVLAAILREEPDYSAIAIAPPALQRIIRRCLRKDQQSRLRDIADARIEIDEMLSETVKMLPAAPGLTASRPSRRAMIVASAAALVLAALAAAATWMLAGSATAASSPPARVAVPIVAGQELAIGPSPPLALSADGRRLVYVSSPPGGRTQLFMRPIDRFESTAIAGTEGASAPFFSPDGAWVGFYAADAIQKVSLDGGAPLKIADTPPVSSAAWIDGGGIIFGTTLEGDGLWRVSADGGTPERLTTPDQKQKELHHLYPQPLSASQMLFTVLTDQGRWGAILTLDTKQWQRLAQVRPAGGAIQSTSTGQLVFAQAGGLVAVPFDARSGAVTGSPVPNPDRVLTAADGGSSFAVSGSGTLAYVPGRTAVPHRTLVFVDREGRATPLADAPAAYAHPRFSSDGRWLAMSIESENGSDVWLQDLQRGTRTRLTSSESAAFPVWTADAARVAFHAGRGGAWSLYARPADGSRPAEPLLTASRPEPSAAWERDPAEKLLPGSMPTLSGANPQYPSSWTPDGGTLAFTERKPNGERDIWVVEKGVDPSPFLMTPSDEWAPTFSRDGQWLAYVSNESGRSEVYVQPYPGPGGRWLISTNGGSDPVWSPDGRELFYLQDDRLMSVTIGVTPAAAGSGAGPRLTAGTPRRLFEGRYERSAIGRNYDLAPDGQRFIMVVSDERAAPPQIHVVLNWFSELVGRAQK